MLDNRFIESRHKQVNKMNLEQLLQENEMLKKRIREIADDARCYAGCSHEGTLQGGLLEIHEDLLKLINGE